MTIQEVANSLGGVLILIFLFWQVLEKVCGNFEWFQKMKKKKIEAEKKRQEEIVQKTTEKVAEQILTPIIATFEEKNRIQDEKLEMLIKSSNDMLRKDIVRIYYKYLPYKKILQYDKNGKYSILLKNGKVDNYTLDDVYDKEKNDWIIVTPTKRAIKLINNFIK